MENLQRLSKKLTADDHGRTLMDDLPGIRTRDLRRSEQVIVEHLKSDHEHEHEHEELKRTAARATGPELD